MNDKILLHIDEIISTIKNLIKMKLAMIKLPMRQDFDKLDNDSLINCFNRDYDFVKNQIGLLLNELGFEVNGEADFFECPILITDSDFSNIVNTLEKSNSFISALKKHMQVFNNVKSKEDVKEFRRTFELEGGLPFFKGKYKVEDK